MNTIQIFCRAEHMSEWKDIDDWVRENHIIRMPSDNAMADYCIHLTDGEMLAFVMMFYAYWCRYSHYFPFWQKTFIESGKKWYEIN